MVSYENRSIFALLAIVLTILSGFSPAKGLDDQLVNLQMCWRYRSPDLLTYSPATDESNLYIAEAGGRISAISLTNGTRLWSTDLGGENRSNVIVFGKYVYVITTNSQNHSKLDSLSRTTGVPNLEIEIPFSKDARIGLADEKLIVVIDSGTIQAFSLVGSKSDWQIMVPQAQLETVLFAGDRLYVASADRKIHSIDPKTGSDAEVLNSDNVVTAISLIGKDLAYGDVRGNLVRLNERNPSWRFKNGGRTLTINSTERGVIVSSADNFVYLISSYYGDIRWKKRMSGRISGLVVDKDVVAVQTVGEPVATLLNIENGKAVGQIVIPAGDSFIRPPLISESKIFFFTSTQILAEGSDGCFIK